MSGKKSNHSKSQGKPLIQVSKQKSNELFFIGIALFLISFLLYSNTINHKYVLDDFGALADNWVVKKGFEGIPIILKSSYRFGINMLTDNLYRPLSQVMFAIEWQISPKNPALSHFVNVLFYALSCVLLFIVLLKYLSKYHYGIAFLIALIYAVHPLHTEVVANIKSRDEIMSFFFLMVTLLLLHRWFLKRHVLSLVLASSAFFLAMMSKEGVVTMLAVIPFLGWYFTESKRGNILIATLAMVLPVVAYLAIRHGVLSQYNVTASVSVVDNFLNAAPTGAAKFATAIMLLDRYLLLTIVPYQLVTDYSFNQIPIVGLSDWKFLGSLLVYLALIGYVVKNILKKSPIVFGVIFYLATISIYSNVFFSIGSSFAERFMFLPSLGFAIVAVFLLLRLFRYSTERTDVGVFSWLRTSTVLLVILGTILVAYGAKTVVRAGEWKDQYTLFGKDVKRSPNSAHMRYYWGLAIRDKALEDQDVNAQKSMMLEAIAQFEKAAAIYPLYADCYEQLGLAYYRVKDLKKAMENYRIALQYNDQKAVTWSNLGIIYFEQGDFKKALELYSKALALDPNYSDGYFNYGSTLGMMGRYEEAIQAFEKCISYDPENAKAHQFIGLTYQNLHREAEAKPWFEKAAMLEQKKAREKKIK